MHHNLKAAALWDRIIWHFVRRSLFKKNVVKPSSRTAGTKAVLGNPTPDVFPKVNIDYNKPQRTQMDTCRTKCGNIQRFTQCMCSQTWTNDLNSALNLVRISANVPRVKHSNEQAHKVKVTGLSEAIMSKTLFWVLGEKGISGGGRKWNPWWYLSERVRAGTAGERNMPSSHLWLGFSTTSCAGLICFRKKEKAFQDRTSGYSSVSDARAFPWEELERTASSTSSKSKNVQIFVNSPNHWNLWRWSFSVFSGCLLLTWFCLVWCVGCLLQRCWPASLISPLPLSCKLLQSKQSQQMNILWSWKKSLC